MRLRELVWLRRQVRRLLSAPPGALGAPGPAGGRSPATPGLLVGTPAKGEAKPRALALAGRFAGNLDFDAFRQESERFRTGVSRSGIEEMRVSREAGRLCWAWDGEPRKRGRERAKPTPFPCSRAAA